MTSWQLNGFTEERELGAGGSGRVVLARHDGTGNEVAIKYLAHWLATDEAHLTSFRTEAQLMAGLVSPHLVTLYEYVETTAGAAIVMDLLEGVALRKMLDDGGPLTPEAALALMKGSLLGLAALHAQGVVHRDYKPENVMVDATGGTKLVDYGIAAPVGEIAGVSGTPLYMAPEQWRGEPSNAATDVYAATATFVESLTGRPMFAGTTVGALLHQHLTVAPPLDELPEAVRPIAAAGLAKDPAERIGDATALLAQLHVLAPAAYGPEWEAHGRAHLAARAALLALLFAHPERLAHEQAIARTDLGNGSAGASSGAAGGLKAARARRPRPLTLGLGALVIGVSAFAITRHSGQTPQSSTAAFEQRQPAAPAGAQSSSASPAPSPTPSPTPTATTTPTVAPASTVTPASDPVLPPPPASPTLSVAPLVTPTPPVSPTPSATPSPTASPTPSPTPSPSATPSPTPSPTPPPPPPVLTKNQPPAVSPSPPPIVIYAQPPAFPAPAPVAVPFVPPPAPIFSPPPVTPTPEPVPAPTPTPTPVETPSPTPSPEPSETPSPEPTETPSPVPTDTPTPEPTETPTPEPTDTPSPVPTDTPSPEPTETPTPDPTETPSPTPYPTPTDPGTETPPPYVFMCPQLFMYFPPTTVGCPPDAEIC